jgi:hypothetical protein
MNLAAHVQMMGDLNKLENPINVIVIPPVYTSDILALQRGIANAYVTINEINGICLQDRVETFE